MRRFSRTAVRTILLLAILAAGAWGVGAIWFRLPAPEPARILASSALALLAVAAIVGVVALRHRALTFAFAAVVAGLIIWWSTIVADGAGNFPPELSERLTARIEGDTAIVSNVRGFVWRSENDFTPHWEERTYDLSSVRTIDLFNVYWAGPLIAHTIISFGFADGRQLAFSIEVRRRTNQVYSTLGGFFKQYDLIFIGADERDLLGLRKWRGEDAHLFRLRASPQIARALLSEYLVEANVLARTPEFYNTLTANCTTEIARLLHWVGVRYRYDWRILANGYLPDYLYESGVLNQSASLDELRRLGAVRERMNLDLDSTEFSAALRVGVPAAPAASER